MSDWRKLVALLAEDALLSLQESLKRPAITLRALFWLREIAAAPTTPAKPDSRRECFEVALVAWMAESMEGDTHVASIYRAIACEALDAAFDINQPTEITQWRTMLGFGTRH